MSQPYQNSPSQGYGAAYGQAYYSSQSPYGQRPTYTPASYPQHAAHAPAPFQPVPNPSVNPGRFDANTQAPPPAQPFPFPAASFPPEVLKQFANAGIPPPPPPGFPPMHIPNLNFTQFQQPHPASPSSQLYPPQNQVSDDGADAYDPRFPQNILQTLRASAPSIPSIRAVQETGRKENQSGSAASHTVSQGEYHSEPQQFYGRPQFPANLDGTDLPPAPSAPLTSKAGGQLSVEAHPHPVTVTVPQPSFPSQNQSAMGTIMSRQDAAPAESIPPKVPSPKPATAPDTQAPQAARISPTTGGGADPDYGSRSVSELRNLAKGALLSFAPHGIQFEELAREGIHPEVLKQLYGELGMRLGTSPAPTGTAQPQSSVPIATSVGAHANLEPENTTPAPAISPNLERKDRIAQLLAAKAGRPGPVRTPSESKASIPAAAPSQMDVQTNLPSPSHGGSTVVLDGEHQSANVAKGKAQGELARQQMEQLRKGANQGQTSSDPTAPPSLHISMPQSGAAMHALSSPFTSGIPGLAIMSGDDEGESSPRPAKRPLEADGDPSITEWGHKRQNTGLSTRTEGEAMEIDSSSQDASEGEVVESPPPSKGPQQQNSQAAPTAIAPNTATPQIKSFAGSTITKLTPAQMAEKAEMLKAKFLKQRARQKALQDGLPSLDAEVSRTEHVLAEQHARLEQTKQRIAVLEADLATARQDEQDQLSQIRRSEDQLQEGLSGRKKYTEELQNLTNEQSSTSRGAIDTQPAGLPVGLAGVSAATATIAPVADRQPESVQEKDPQLVEEAFSDESAGTAETGGSGAVEEALAAETGIDRTSGSSTGEMGEGSDDPDDINANGPGLSEQAEALSTQQDLLETEQRRSNSSSADADESDGSASMSDSASEMEQEEQEEGEYEPPEDDPTQPMDIDEGSSDDYEPTDTPMDLSAAQDDLEEGEEVEPEAGEPAALNEDPAGLPTAEAPEIDAQSAVQRGLELIEQQADSEPIRVHDSGADQVPNRNSAPATPSARWNRGRPNIRPLANSGESKSNSFSAYQSPLTSFPAYRHNELFDESAKDGFRSLTYSNKIDPKVPLCTTELAGEVCQDSQCEEQHFRHLGLTGKLVHPDP